MLSHSRGPGRAAAAGAVAAAKAVAGTSDALRRALQQASPAADHVATGGELDIYQSRGGTIVSTSRFH
eukprot:scaffold15196_cov63-Phaeocystis_antarctica.AAC.3